MHEELVHLHEGFVHMYEELMHLHQGFMHISN